jgi:hypothetical protein
MPGEVNYKQKYLELRQKYMNSVDVAFRLGFEEGAKQSQLDNAGQQMAQAQAEKEASAGAAAAPGQPPKENNNSAPGTPDQGSGPDKSGSPSIQPKPVEGAPAAKPDGSPMKESENPAGSELDQHIAKLESMIQKSENPAEDLKKSLDELKELSKNLKFQAELKKSAEAIPAIAKALHKPQFKFGVQAQHNLTSTAKSALSMHHKIVGDIMEKWEKEESKAGKDILSVLGIEGATKD